VLTNGLPRLEEALDRAAEGNRVLGGDDAFRLYDSLGVPLDFMEDLAGQRGLAIDREGYDRAMEAQRERARTGSAFKTKASEIAWQTVGGLGKELESTRDDFVGYETTRVDGVPILAVFGTDGVQTERLAEGAKGYVVLPKSPFYIESGGQIADVGNISGPRGEARVEGVLRGPNWPRLHAVQVLHGTLSQRDIVTAQVRDDIRDATRRNHTATHLLHAALRQVLGTHVKQAG